MLKAAVTIEKSRVFKELQESLEEMTRTKTHLQLCVDSSGLVTMTLTSDGKLGTIHRPELLGIGADSVKSMKLTSYEFFIGADNPVLSSDISKAQKSVVPISGRNYRFRMGSQSWNVHYSIAQMKDDSATKSAPTSSDVKIAIFIEIVDDERIIFETLGRCLPPQLVHQAMQPTEITKLRGNCQNLTLISASITNCGYFFGMYYGLFTVYSQCNS